MLTSSELLSVFKKSHSNCSNYRTAKILGVSITTVGRWANGQTTMSEDAARKAAELAGVDVDYAVACIHAEMHKNDDLFPVWINICRKLAPHRKAA
jgi:transcriptional regulator with XRE-family HTH domain